MAAYVDAAAIPSAPRRRSRKSEPDPDRAAAAHDPGAAADARGRQVRRPRTRSMFFTPDALEQATRLRVAEHRAARLAAARPAQRDRPGLRHRRRPASPSPAPASPRRASTSTRCGSPRRAPTSPPSACPAPSRSPTRPTHRPARLRRGLRRPGPPRRPRPGLRRRRLDPAVALRPGPPAGTRRRQGRPGHPARRASPTASRPSGSATPARSRRPPCGRRGSRPPAARRPPVDRRRRPAGWPPSPTRTTRTPGSPARSATLGAFLYEPDGAVIRAGLVTAVAAGVDGGLLDEHIAYVTGDASFRTPVRPLLPGPRGAALPGEAAQGGPARARHRLADDQEARRRDRARAAAQAPRPARRQRRRRWS